MAVDHQRLEIVERRAEGQAALGPPVAPDVGVVGDRVLELDGEGEAAFGVGPQRRADLVEEQER
jgi:hypothetical protein